MSNVYSFSTAAVQDEDPSELRNAPRRRVLKTGKIAYKSRLYIVECVVRDVSDTGAKLRAEHMDLVPDSFELLIEIDGLEADCEVVWRKGNNLGVKFIGAPRLVEPARKQVVQSDVPATKSSIFKHPVKTK